jgi:hypothetical protein
MNENEADSVEKLAREVSSLSPEDQIYLARMVLTSIAEKDPATLDEIRSVIARAMYPDKPDPDDWAEYQFFLSLARKVKDGVRKRLERRRKATL